MYLSTETETRETEADWNIKNMRQNVNHWLILNVQSLSREDPLEKGIATHSSILAWRIPWTEDPGQLQSIGCKSRTQLSDYQNKKNLDEDIWVFIILSFQLCCRYKMFQKKLQGNSISIFIWIFVLLWATETNILRKPWKEPSYMSSHNNFYWVEYCLTCNHALVLPFMVSEKTFKEPYIFCIPFKNNISILLHT